jgi:hypothetical protein
MGTASTLRDDGVSAQIWNLGILRD